jgi:hypothetical protein
MKNPYKVLWQAAEDEDFAGTIMLILLCIVSFLAWAFTIAWIGTQSTLLGWIIGAGPVAWYSIRKYREIEERAKRNGR